MDECTFIILGATGDLTKRKLIPAIYHLVKRKKIENFAIIGIARRQLTEKNILDSSKEYIKNIDAQTWKKITNSFYYYHFDFQNTEGYKELTIHLKEIEKKHKLENRLFYLATLPEHFDLLTHHIGKSGLTKTNGWNRVVYEKPFGYDLKTAKKMNECIKRVFKESQIYRIDHYLGKEIVGNIALLRFTNRIIEPLWNNKHVQEVQIILNEKEGVQDRANFYDKTGALRDVVQNHMMQMLALTTMEQPKKLTGEHIRNAKAKALSKVKVKNLILGQYEGYEVAKSKTETYAAIKLEVNTPRWKGVPFYLKTGKKLQTRAASIYLKFKEVKCLLNYCPRDTNYLELRIQPELGFAIELNAKVPEKNQVVPVKMDFCHDCIWGENTAEAYELLIEDAIKGDQSMFVRNDEIELAWKIIDTMKKKKTKLQKYTANKEPNFNVRWKI